VRLRLDQTGRARGFGRRAAEICRRHRRRAPPPIHAACRRPAGLRLTFL